MAFRRGLRRVFRGGRALFLTGGVGVCGYQMGFAQHAEDPWLADRQTMLSYLHHEFLQARVL